MSRLLVVCELAKGIRHGAETDRYHQTTRLARLLSAARSSAEFCEAVLTLDQRPAGVGDPQACGRRSVSLRHLTDGFSSRLSRRCGATRRFCRHPRRTARFFASLPTGCRPRALENDRGEALKLT